MATPAPSDEIVAELREVITVYKDGRIIRHRGGENLPSGIDLVTGVISKDVVISPETGLSARVYLPQNVEHSAKKLPLVVYCHGGGFIIQSVASALYHPYLNTLVAESGAIAVSVDYRLAPEYPVPISHLDCWSALQWVAQGGEPWLSLYADFNRIFLVGESAGANIVHHMAMFAGGQSGIPGQTVKDNLPIEIFGAILVHPYFWGSKRIGKESAPQNLFWCDVFQRMWKMSCSTTCGLDDPIINPLAPESPSLAGLGCRRVFIAVASNDALSDRGWLYYEALKKSGWDGEVEMEETNGHGHVFHLFLPDIDESKLFIKRLASFINRP